MKTIQEGVKVSPTLLQALVYLGLYSHSNQFRLQG